MMMENYSYMPFHITTLNMAKQGFFGDIVHGDGAYNTSKMGNNFGKTVYWNMWWLRMYGSRNGNIYPTHGMGPIAQMMNINRGDRFDFLVSMSGPSRGLQEYAQEQFPEGSPQRDETFTLGDVNVSLLQTANGKTIYVSHDTNLPRPYSRIHLVQGTKGIFQGYPNRVYVEGMSPAHRWEDWQDRLEEFDHPIWKDLEEQSAGAGHGGMDFIEDYRLIKCLREGLPTDMNVYDAAAISAVGPLSGWSVANRSRPVDFPDFTRGRWKEWPQLGLVRA